MCYLLYVWQFWIKAVCLLWYFGDSRQRRPEIQISLHVPGIVQIYHEVNRKQKQESTQWRTKTRHHQYSVMNTIYKTQYHQQNQRSQKHLNTIYTTKAIIISQHHLPIRQFKQHQPATTTRHCKSDTPWSDWDSSHLRACLVRLDAEPRLGQVLTEGLLLKKHPTTTHEKKKTWA